MGADPTCDQINDWFKIGSQVRVDTIPQSQLGGFPLDPDTGKAAVVNYRPVCASYKRYLDRTVAAAAYSLQFSNILVKVPVR